MDTTSDLLKVCKETREIVANILKGKKQLKRTVEETADSSLPSDAQLPDKRSRNSYNTQPSDNENENDQMHLGPAYDRTKFYERLETFADAYIENKRPLTAIQCAMHGFVDTHQLEGPNHDIAKLECVDCQGTNYVIDISNIDEHSVRLNQVVEKYTSGLYTFHRDGCFWKTNACPATIYSFPKLSTLEALDMVRQSGHEWLQSGVQLPKIIHPLNSRQSTQLDFLIRDFQNPADRYKFTITLPSDLSDAVGTSYLLPVFGWHYAEPNSIKCMDCFRKKNLHELAALEDPFNVIKEHRDYCPWVNSNNAHVESPQATPFKGQLCGYQWMLAALDLEYTLLLRMQEDSPVYQASREQWFIDEQKRMQKLRETLDREFTVFSQQPESQPPADEHALPTIAVTDEGGEQQHVEKQPTVPEEPSTTAEQQQHQEVTTPVDTTQPPPSPGKQDDDDLGEYLESENEVEEEEVKEPAVTTTPVPDDREEEIAKQQGFEDEEELDESLLEEVGDVPEPEQADEAEKLVDTTAVTEEQVDKMDVDEQESTAADTTLHLDTLDHDMAEAATETEAAEAEQVIETTPSSVAEKEEGEVTSVNEEPTIQEDTAAAAIDKEQAEESTATPLDVATETVDESEQQVTHVMDAPATTTSESENQLQPEQVPTQPTETASTDEITAMEQETTAEEALIETPKDVLPDDSESGLQTAAQDQTLSAEDELKEFAESPLPTTVEEKQELDQPDTNTATQDEEAETRVPVSENDQEKEHEDVTVDSAPQNENVQEETVVEMKEATGSTAEAPQQNQDDLLLEDDQQKEEAKEALDVESAQEDNISTPMDVYIEEESGDVTESAPATSAADSHVETHAEKVADKDESIVDKQDESLVNNEEESTVDKEDGTLVESKEETVEEKVDESIVQDNEESLATKEDGMIEEKQDESLATKEDEMIEEKQDESLATKEDEMIEEKQVESLVDKDTLNIENELITEKSQQVVEQQPIVEEPSVKDNDVEAPANVSETPDDYNDAQHTVPTVTVIENEDDQGVVPVGNAMDELHAKQTQAIDTSTHVQKQEITHDDQQKDQQDTNVQFGDADQEQGSQDNLSNSDAGEKGDAMDEVEVEVHEVPDSVEDKEMVKEDIDKEGTSSVEREETGVAKEEDQDQMEL